MEYKKLGDYCEVKGGKRLPKGEQLVEYETNHPYLRISDYSNGSVNLNNLKYVTEETFQKISRYIINEGDIFLSIVGTIGIVDFIDYKLDSASLTENAVRIRSFNESVLSTKFLSYFLKSNQGQNEMFIRTVGSTQPKLAITRIKDINIPIIDIKSQQKISNILSTIDEKITLNKNLIANLEELSQTLFKRWFVDFEFPDENGNPYKSSGGEMIDSELGEIPSDWKIIELKEVTEIIMGQSPKSDTYNTQNEGIPLLNGATDFKNRNIKPTKYTTDPKKIGQLGDFVFGVRATVGLVTELDRDYAIGRGAGIARINTTHKEWLYEILVKAFQYFENSISGSVYINVSSNDLKNSKVIYPSKEILDAYHKNLVSNFELVKSMKMQIKHLTELRDTLLPKLMSGELEIPDDIEVNEDELSI
ncbi:restriction endonuclease subunit S [Staphylococcus equorum]|uniref:restriction endonuclease subunit S n=1 Tax=Staphylococcus equorum TaxID=246432 RepID=UPI000D1CDF5A|nr:restriction endonuclease subunit S [Staphylococcus equorum]PTF10062.1 restriction endonuclease subunit S [Staphylococcus equorum]